MTADRFDNEQGRRATPYRAVWRWHFYAGLCVAPVLVLLAITGAIYLFDHELDAAWNRQLLQVEGGATTTPLAQQEAVVLASWPDATVTSLVLPRAKDQASRWNLRLASGAQREVFVDPHTAQIRGSTDPDLNPMKIVRDLHAGLMAGKAGRHVVELVACWTLVMLITGLYLWWPRSWRLAAFWPRRGTTGRAFWRDWHAIPSMLNALLVIFLVLTGMPWSVFWGTQFARLGEHVSFVAPSPNFTSAPPPQLTGLPWTVQHHGTPQGAHIHTASIAAVEPALQSFDIAADGPGLRVFYPSVPGAVFIASYVPARAQAQRTLYLDSGDGRVLGQISWRDYSSGAKAIEWGVMTHMGKQYGRANQLAGLAVCLIIVGAVIAGIVLWWQRRPRGQLAAPEPRPGDQLPRFMVITLVALGVAFPLLGASLLLVWAIERYAARDSGLGRPMA